MSTGSVDATCARCGHPAETGTPGSGHSPWGCDVRECHCAGYRTPEQQAAWEELEREHQNLWEAEETGHSAIFELCLRSIATVAGRLLELYP